MKLLRASAMTGRPIVTFSGESPFEAKDVVFDTAGGRLLGFTLREHGFFGGPVSQTLAHADVHAIGSDAIVIASEEAIADDGPLAGDAEDQSGVIGASVLTEDGVALGEIAEVIVSAGADSRVVGFEIEASKELNAKSAHVFIPLPHAVAISDDRLIVPAEAREFVRDDLSGFGAAVAEYRARLTGDG